VDQEKTGQGAGEKTPATRTLLAVGGRRHGEEIELRPGDTTWVDLMCAETYFVREFKYVRRDPVNPRSMSLRTGYKAQALMHESIAQDGQLAQQWWMGLALERMFRTVGWEVPISEIIGNQPPQSPNGRTGHGDPSAN
jgi:hypothetical protein